MAFGLVPLEKRLKDHIRNYSLDQIFDIGVLSDYLDSINKLTGLSLLLTDRHGEKAVSLAILSALNRIRYMLPAERSVWKSAL